MTTKYLHEIEYEFIIWLRSFHPLFSYYFKYCWFETEQTEKKSICCVQSKEERCRSIGYCFTRTGYYLSLFLEFGLTNFQFHTKSSTIRCESNCFDAIDCSKTNYNHYISTGGKASSGIKSLEPSINGIRNRTGIKLITMYAITRVCFGSLLIVKVSSRISP